MAEEQKTVEQEFEPKAESQAEVFNYVVERGKQEALLSVKERFEDDPNEENRLEFHNRRHTADAIRRAKAILEALERAGLVNKRDVKLGEFVAAYHDTVQEWEENSVKEKDGNEKVMRKRFGGKNEEASTAEALAFVDRMSQEKGDKEAFTDADKLIIAQAIGVTVPGFDPEKGTVVQPNLKEESSFITHAIALGDLGTAGMDGSEKFSREGDALFREENLDIIRALKNQTEEIPEDKKEYFRTRMLGWSKFQATFAEGRKAKLEDELRGIPEEGRVEIRKLFSKFDDSIAQAKKIAENRESMAFDELTKDMGYSARGSL